MKLDDIIEHNIKDFLGCKLSPNFYTILNFIVITPLIVYVLTSQTSSKNWILLLILALSRALLDIADGTVARNCNKCSKLGACLDIVTDTVFALILSSLIVFYWSKNGFKNKYLMTFVLILLLLITVACVEQCIDEMQFNKRPLSDFSTFVKDNSIIITPLYIILTKLYINYLIK